METSKYKGLYLQETNEHLSGIENGLLLLEKNLTDASAVDNLFRHYHSIKGMSASMGYEPIQKLAHAQEDVLSAIRSKRACATVEVTRVLFECLDKLKDLVKKVESDEALPADIGPFIKKLKSALDGAPAAQPGVTAPSTEAQAAELRLSNVMKVEVKVFDDLLTSAGDLFMSLTTFKKLSQGYRAITFKDAIYTLGKTVNKLHNNILSARMLPVKDLIEGLPRIIRDISVKSGKAVELKVEGADISLDRSILENLSGPLVHIIRNSVDHGIETPDERTRVGKPPQGTITVRAYGKKDRVVISVSDDGGGIDVGKVRIRAAEKGMPPERVKSLSDEEALMLICLPGISTSDSITETSGRGVGMDVVKNAVEALSGSLTIESAPGKGTGIIMELPRSTSIIKTLLVNVAGEMFLLPISKVEKVLDVDMESISGGLFTYMESPIPVISLGKMLGMAEDDRGREICTIVVAEASSGAGAPLLKENEKGKYLVAIKVDGFEDEIDAYIRPLMPPMSRLWGVTGVTIMGDGRPVFLVDMAQIISKADCAADHYGKGRE